MMTVFTITETVFMLWLFNKALQSRTQGKKKLVVVLASFVILSAAFVSIAQISLLPKLIITFAVMVTATLVMYSNPWYQCVFCVFLVSYELIICDIITSNLLSIILGDELQKIVEHNTPLFTMLGIISKFFAVIVIYVSAKFIKRIDLNIPGKYWVILDVIMALFYISNIYFIRLDTIMVDLRDHIDITLMSFSHMIIAILVFYTFMELSRYYMRRSEHNHILMQNEFLYDQLIHKREAEREIRVLRHDMLNHLSSLHLLYKTGQSEKYEKYFEKLADIAQTPFEYKITGIFMIDAVIGVKQKAAEKHGVIINVKVENVRANISVDEYKITSVLANLLDNAIEAAAGADNREITMMIAGDKEKLQIRLSNHFSKNFHVPVITDHVHIGLGFGIIRSSVEELGGTIVSSQEGDVFTADVIIPVGENG